MLACNAAGAAPHARVQHDITHIGVGPDHVLEQMNRLLRRVNLARIVAVRECQNVARVSVAIVYSRYAFKPSIIAGASSASGGGVGLARRFLRMICREVLVKYKYVFMRPEGHSVRVQKPHGHRFLPDPLIAKPFAVGIYQICGKWLLGK